MYCSKCGNEIKDGDKFCTKCGESLKEHNTSNDNNIDTSNTHLDNNSNNTKQTNNSILLAGIICSVVGLFIYGWLLGIIAIILSLIGMQQPNISTNNKETAIVAIIIGVIDIVGALFAFNMIFNMLFK